MKPKNILKKKWNYSHRYKISNKPFGKTSKIKKIRLKIPSVVISNIVNKKIKSKNKKKPSDILKINWKGLVKNTSCFKIFLNWKKVKKCQKKWFHFFKITKGTNNWKSSILRKKIGSKNFKENWSKLSNKMKDKSRKNWKRWATIKPKRRKDKWDTPIKIENLRFSLTISASNWDSMTKKISSASSKEKSVRELESNPDHFPFKNIAYYEYLLISNHQ